MSNGIVFYEGPSLIDSSPIVGIVTTKTANKKTGALLQTWILRRDMSPVRSINVGGDHAICGDCPLRGILTDARNRGRACYVNVAQAPQSIWMAYKRGRYPRIHHRHHDKRLRHGLRLGAYGDPTAIPRYAWNPLLVRAQGSTPGYTHQWKQRRFQHWSRNLMASTSTVEETYDAWAMGWRTFRVRPAGTPLLPGEGECPASPAGGNKHTCETCGACDGMRRGPCDRRPSMSIEGHGGPSRLSSLLHIIQ